MKAIINGKSLLGLDQDGEIISRPCASDDLSPEYIDAKSKTEKSVIYKGAMPKTDKYTKVLCRYCSGTFKPAEEKYPIHQKETLACMRVLQKWRVELLPTRFELCTDSSYVTGFWRYKLESDRRNGRLIRTQLTLHQYKPYLKLIKSENNQVADTLTREWSQ